MYDLPLKLPKIVVVCDSSPSLFKLQSGILPLLIKLVFYLKTTFLSKLEFFLWTKLLENFVLAKYLIPITVTLIIISNIKLNPVSTNFTKWPNTLKKFVDNLPTNYLSVFGHFVKLALKGLRCKSIWNWDKNSKVWRPTITNQQSLYNT